VETAKKAHKQKSAQKIKLQNPNNKYTTIYNITQSFSISNY